jgi:hypothetical protein
MASETRNQWAGAHDLWLEVFLLFNFACLTGDILLAHSENSFRNPAEYIPLGFSGAAAILLFVGLVSRVKSQSLLLWKWFGYGIGWISVAVGIAGVAYHLESSFFYERTLRSLTYAAPFAAPLAYVGLGCLLLMNRMVPFPTTEWAKWTLLFTLGGFAGNFGLSLSDHAVNGFYHWTEWIPVFSCALAVGFLIILFAGAGSGQSFKPCALVLVLQIIVGVAGFFLHGQADLHGPSASLVQNVIHGAPPFAPMLLPNLALLGLLGLLALDRVLPQSRIRNQPAH